MFAARAVAVAFAGATLATASTVCDSGKPCHSQAETENLLMQLSAVKVSQRQWRPPAVAKPRAARARQQRRRAGECNFRVAPETPYYWEPDCDVGLVGCWADGVHAECRFCSYDGIPCPESTTRPSRSVCSFPEEQKELLKKAYYVEPQCPEVDGGLGCKADGLHPVCRWCGGNGSYSDIACQEVERCTFANEPMIPSYWSDACAEGGLGCMADGIHQKCRFCGARPFESVSCPESAKIPEHACWFRNEPQIPYFWDESCKLGDLGCWADGIHEKCRFCSKTRDDDGVYGEILCPESE